MRRLIRLLFGLFLFALGMVVQIRANVGYAPWDVLHAGLSKVLGISFGQAGIGLGFLFVILVWRLGEAIGLGTILNMLLIGMFADLLLRPGVIPEASGIFRFLYLAVGIFIIAFAVYFYAGAGFGAGPRDSLNFAIHRLSGLSVGTSRVILEGSAALIGFLLGGSLGIGTLLSAVFTGVALDLISKPLHFEPNNIPHETLADTTIALKEFCKNRSRS